MLKLLFDTSIRRQQSKRNKKAMIGNESKVSQRAATRLPTL
jgi:hypothetical protein